jgi:hypothetical protein
LTAFLLAANTKHKACQACADFGGPKRLTLLKLILVGGYIYIFNNNCRIVVLMLKGTLVSNIVKFEYFEDCRMIAVVPN